MGEEKKNELRNITRQSLPDDEYLMLLGICLSVFLSNNSFIIETILKNQIEFKYDWYTLIDCPSGELVEQVRKVIIKESGKEIWSLFSDIVSKRNRIIHGFRVTHGDEQVIASKNKKHKQIIIDKKYLKDFIELNQELSSMLHKNRGY